jgi:hypothetical protein
LKIALFLVLPSKILVIFEPEVGDFCAVFFEAKGFSTVSTARGSAARGAKRSASAAPGKSGAHFSPKKQTRNQSMLQMADA